MAKKNPVLSLFAFTFLGFLRPAIGLLLLPIYLQHISPEEYGILTLILMFTSIAIIFTNLKLDTAMRTFYFDYSHDKKQLDEYLKTIFTSSLILALIVYFFLLLIGPNLFDLIFENERITFYPYGFLALTGGLLNLIPTTYFIYLKNQVKLQELTFYTLLNIILIIAIQYFMIVKQGKGILGILWGTLISNAVVLLIVMLKTSLLTLKINRTMVKNSLRFSIPLIPFLFLHWVGMQGDRYFVERFLTLELVGIYALLMNIVGATALLLNALDNALRPFIFEDFKSKTRMILGRIEVYYLFYVIVGLAGLSGIIMIGSNLHLLTDNSAYLSVRTYFAFAALAIVPTIFTRLFNFQLIFLKASKSLTKLTTYKTIVLVGLFIVLIPKYELWGALLAILVSNLLNAFIFYKKSKELMNLPLNYSVIIKLVLIVITIVLVGYFQIPYLGIGWFGIIQFILVISIFCGWAYFKKGFIRTLFEQKN